MNAQQTCRILVVDDNAADVELATLAFESDGFPAEINAARDGGEAIDVLRQAADGDIALPSLILLDINMPRIDGLAVLRFLRSRAEFTEIPVVMLTTSDSANDRDRCQVAGASGYLVKPRRFADFVALIHGLRPLVGL